MTNEKKEKTLTSRHKIGWFFAAVFTVLWVIAGGVYETFRASFEATVATGQVNDSVVEYSLIQKVLYGDLGPTLIAIVFLVFIGVSLFPTVMDLLKSRKMQTEETGGEE